jgi:dephospho-CoA kinase
VLIVALTGGIGSGKSLVSQYFAELGAQVVDADQLSRQVMERGTVGFDAVVATFGDAILRDGDIDRRALGELVFSTSAERRKLEAIVHPLVRAAFDSVVFQLRKDDLLIYEIPLLVETDSASRFDYVITVEADSKMRRERLKDRGMHESDVNARIAAQAGEEERAESADYVIRNDGSTDELLREVEFLWETVFPALKRAKT